MYSSISVAKDYVNNIYLDNIYMHGRGGSRFLKGGGGVRVLEKVPYIRRNFQADKQSS